MNLALLDPFRRQVPDRIDSTLTLPRNFHPKRPVKHETPLGKKKSSKSTPTHSKKRKAKSSEQYDRDKYIEEMNEWHSCFAVAFNRRGNYIAAGHGSGAVPFHDFASRTLSSIFTPPHSSLRNTEKQQKMFQNGITSVSWSRRSRHVMIASFNDRHVCLLDNTHPFGVQDAFNGLTNSSKVFRAGVDVVSVNASASRSNSPVPKSSVEKGDDDTEAKIGSQEGDDTSTAAAARNSTDSRINATTDEMQKQSYQRARYVNKLTHLESEINGCSVDESNADDGETEETYAKGKIRYQAVVMSLPKPLGVCAQLHPRGSGGLACLEDGSLILFRLPAHAFQTSTYSDSGVEGNYVYLCRPSNKTLASSEEKPYHVVCATFDAHGSFIYAATKCGKLLFFELDKDLKAVLFSHPESSKKRVSSKPTLLCKFRFMEFRGSTMAHQIVLSRNGQMLLLNCKDSLKLYDTSECWGSTPRDNGEINVKPRFNFQDVVSKSKWYACDFSGDGEYVVGGCNNEEAGDKYELYFWNTTTGKLILLR